MHPRSYSRRAAACMLAALLLAFTTTGGLVKAGNRALAEGDPNAALEAYGQALERAPGAPEILFDTGLARAAAGDPAAAREAFLAALAGGGEGLRGAIEYNVGNTYFAEANYGAAATAYRAALAAGPMDQDAKANLELTLRRMAAQEKQEPQEGHPQGPHNDGEQGPGAEQQGQTPPDQPQGEPPETDQQDAAQDPPPESRPSPADPGAEQSEPQGPADHAPQEEPPAGEGPSPSPQDQAQPSQSEGQGAVAGEPRGEVPPGQMDPLQVDQLLDALQSREEDLQQQVRARLVPVAPRPLEQDW